MLIFGIETSCDETAAAVVRDGREVLSTVVASQDDLHAEFGGVVPELASRAHSERILPVITAALSRAGASFDDIDAVAVGHRPGLIGSLLVGVAAAKALAWSLEKPLIGVDHVHAHVFSGLLGADVRPAFPLLGLVVSGGHTSLYDVRAWDDFTRIGATIDDAVGEAFDKAAAILGIPFPGGPNLDRLARTAGVNDRAIELPVARPGALDFSFSGLKTALLYAVRGVPRRGGGRSEAPALSDARRADLAATFERAAVDAVVQRVGRAVDDMRARGASPGAVLAGGGVTANSRLRAALSGLCAERDISLILPAREYCIDNGAMIAGLGFELLARGRTDDLTLAALPTTAC